MANVSLPMNKIADVLVTVPGIAKQKEIIELEKKLVEKELEADKLYASQLTLLENLNQAILQEAVQGKLVPQNPNDEPATKLLKRIKTEKATLRKAQGKVKTEKPLTPIKPSEIPFEIPESWVWCRLGEIAKNVEYGTSQKAEMTSEHIPVLRMNNIQSGKIDCTNLKYVSNLIDDLPKLFLVDGDMLFNRTNSYELVGKTAIYRGTNNSMTFASYLIRVQYDENVIPEFVSNYVNSPICRETQLEPEIIQQNGQANFNGTKLQNILFPLPPLPEQTRIVAEIEKQLAKTKQLKEHIIASQQATEQLLKALLHQAFEVKETV
jgi:type I restriction enzyme S subunit